MRKCTNVYLAIVLICTIFCIQCSLLFCFEFWFNYIMLLNTQFIIIHLQSINPPCLFHWLHWRRVHKEKYLRPYRTIPIKLSWILQKFQFGLFPSFYYVRAIIIKSWFLFLYLIITNALPIISDIFPYIINIYLTCILIRSS